MPVHFTYLVTFDGKYRSMVGTVSIGIYMSYLPDLGMNPNKQKKFNSGNLIGRSLEWDRGSQVEALMQLFLFFHPITLFLGK